MYLANLVEAIIKMQIRFVGEQGVDGGGLLREYFRLLKEETKQWFHGEDGCMLPLSSAAAIQVYLLQCCS